MLVAPVQTPPPSHHHLHRYEYEGEKEEGMTSHQVLERSSQSADLFLYKSRDINSAPTPPKRDLESFGDSDSSSTSSSFSSTSGYSDGLYNNNSSSTSKINKRSKSSKDDHSHKKWWNWCSFSIHGFFFGHAPAFTTWSTSYASTSRLKYLSLFFLESSLRSIGDVTFCSNPFSGLIIFIAMLISRPLVAFLAFVTLTFGIETAVVFLHFPLEDVRSGGVTFNNFLTGTVIGLIAQQDVILAKPDIIAVCIAIGILTAIIWKGLNGVLVSTYLEFPILNAPFHAMILLYIYSGIASRFEPMVEVVPKSSDIDALEGHQSENLQMNNSTSHLLHHLLGDAVNGHGTTESSQFTPVDMDQKSTFVEPLDWQRIFFGILLAPSQYFGTGSLLTSGMVHLAVFICSPILLLQTLTGAGIGTLLGICLTNPEDYEDLYNGSWALNPLFTTAAIGGFFLVFNFHSWLLSIVGGVISTLLYSTMIKCHVPAFGIPFMLTTWLLLPSIPPPSPLLPSNDSKPEVIVIQANGLDQKQAFEDDVNKKCVQQNKDSSSSKYFIRLHLSDITTPEENRRKFLPKDVHSKIKKCRSSHTKVRKSGGKTEITNGDIEQTKMVISTKNGVMNKYKSSISEAIKQDDGLPPELSLGVEQNSILPL